MIVHIYWHIWANNTLAFLCMFLAYLHIFPESIFVHIQYCIFLNIFLHIDICLEYSLIAGRRFTTALLPLLFGKNPRSHHKGALWRVWTGDQQLSVLCHFQLGQDIPYLYAYKSYSTYTGTHWVCVTSHHAIFMRLPAWADLGGKAHAHCAAACF